MRVYLSAAHSHRTRRTQWLAEKLFFDGVLGHFQSCSKPTLLAAQETMRDMKVLSRTDKGDWVVAAAYVAGDRQKLRELCNRIAAVRRLCCAVLSFVVLAVDCFVGKGEGCVYLDVCADRACQTNSSHSTGGRWRARRRRCTAS